MKRIKVDKQKLIDQIYKAGFLTQNEFLDYVGVPIRTFNKRKIAGFKAFEIIGICQALQCLPSKIGAEESIGGLLSKSSRLEMLALIRLAPNITKLRRWLKCLTS